MKITTPRLAVFLLSDALDVYKAASVGVNYAITRAWSATCNLGYEHRDVTGFVSYSYNATTIGCATAFTFR